MRNFIYKIKSKIVNIDAKLRRKLVIGICACLFIITAVVQIGRTYAWEVSIDNNVFNIESKFSFTYYPSGKLNTSHSWHNLYNITSNGKQCPGNAGCPAAPYLVCSEPSLNTPTIDDDKVIDLSNQSDSSKTDVSSIKIACPLQEKGKEETFSTWTDAKVELMEIINAAAYDVYEETAYGDNSYGLSDYLAPRQAHQAITWEVVCDGRNNLDEAPSKDFSNSFYNIIVKPDSVSPNTSKAYKAILKHARSIEKGKSGGSYKMKWSTSNERYEKVVEDVLSKTDATYVNKFKNSYTGETVDPNSTSSGISKSYNKSKSELTVTSTVPIASSNKLDLKVLVGGSSDYGHLKLYYGGSRIVKDSNTGKYKRCETSSGDCWNQNLIGGGFVDSIYYFYTDLPCVTITKKDENGNGLKGAKFTIHYNGSLQTSDIEVDMTNVSTKEIKLPHPGSYTITETTAPTGYSASASQTVDIEDSSSCTNVEFSDTPLMINWYKTDENGTKLSGAKFNVDNGSVKWSQMGTGNYSSCYVYDPDGTNTEFVSDTNGEVCVIRVPSGNHIVTEVQSAQYHTFGQNKSITISTNTSKQAMTVLNRLINYPTHFEFSKSVSDDETNVDIKNMNTDLLMRLKFNIKQSGKILTFQKVSDGVYRYIDGKTTLTTATGPTTTDLQLDSNRKITVKYLPWTFDYIIEEKNEDGCTDEATEPTCSVATGNPCNGSGYYFDTGVGFKITQGSNDKASSLVTGYGKTTASLVNTPVEITLNKNDIYKYYNSQDKSEIEENENIIDTARFILRDAKGNILKLKKISDGHYRYLPITEEGNFANIVTEINTKNGSLKITHLCRNQVYYIEEVRTTDPASFILPTNVEAPSDKPDAWIWEGHPYVKYVTPNTLTDANNNKQSLTQTIQNIPSRIRFEKRDLKYGYLIPDEKTTFKVYRCDESVDKCHAETGEIVNFDKRAVIQGDNEDPIIDDVVSSVEVYKYSKLNAKNVQELHPYKGILVLRYLPAGYFDEENVYHKYKYVLVETKAPEGYDTPVGEEAETQFEVSDSTVEVEQTKVPNKPSKIIIRKYDSNGKLLTGARFKIYKVNKEDYNENLSAENQQKTLLSLKTVRDGVYEYRKEYDTTEFTTCIDKDLQKCSSVTETLTYEDYTESILKETIEIKQGEAIIQYLDVENFYVIEEVQAPDGYELPKNSEDRFKLIYLKNSVENNDAFTELTNTETTFQFYKFDEYNNLLDGSEFKLQKLNDNKKYIDVNVTKTTIGDKIVYKIDSESENTIITTENGTAILAYMTTGQYRIVETKAAPGKELPKKTLNVVTFFVDESGNVYGNAIITNKAKTETIEIKPEAQAEVIVNIQTGQTVIKYTLIIGILVVATIGLFIIKKRLEKK